MILTKIAESSNSIDPDEVAHNEPPHLNLHCLPFSLKKIVFFFFSVLKFCGCKFFCLLFGS